MTTTWTPIAKGLHWLMAALLLGLLALGLYMTDLLLSPEKLLLYSWHKWLGVSAFLLLWCRLLWRLTHRAPAAPEGVSAGMARLATLGHLALYALMLLIPLSGWLMSSAKGVPTVWFGLWPIPDLLPRDRALGDALQLVHRALNYLLMATIAGHVAAALWHHTVRKDDTLRRMLPARQS
jgi:cytochrome b561